MNIVYRDNGQGLTRDACLIERILREAGHSVTLSPVPPRLPASWRFLRERSVGRVRGLTTDLELSIRSLIPSARWDLNLFLEGMDARFLPHARKNCLMPNQEWLSDEDHEMMRTIDLVLFKTRHAETRLAASTRESVFVGFTSDERRLRGVHREWNSALHVAGWNPHKGTAALIEQWPRHSDWPHLLIVSQRSSDGAPTLEIISHRLPDDALRHLQNARGIHLCPSEVEGFGHSINEARSCGALIVTTDAPPMNELVTPDSGLLIPVDRTSPMGYGTRFVFSRAGLVETMERLVRLPATARVRFGAAARAAYEAERSAFSSQLLAAIEGV